MELRTTLKTYLKGKKMQSYKPLYIVYYSDVKIYAPKLSLIQCRAPIKAE